MPGRVEGKTAIITGAAGGIGSGIARLLAREGCAVVLADLDRRRGAAVAEEIEGGAGEAAFFELDLVNEQSCAACVDVARERFGGLEVLVNCAGIYPRGTLAETTPELWDGIMAVNARGPMLMCKHAVPVMQAAGGGSIINIGSGHAYLGFGNLIAYAASKAALLNLTRTLADVLARDLIRVNMVMPGWVLSDTERRALSSEGYDEEAVSRLIQETPMGREQTPDDAGWAVVYLASDESRNVTGTVLNANGGWRIVG